MTMTAFEASLLLIAIVAGAVGLAAGRLFRRAETRRRKRERADRSRFRRAIAAAEPAGPAAAEADEVNPGCLCDFRANHGRGVV
jgi:hypothetical protein